MELYTVNNDGRLWRQFDWNQLSGVGINKNNHKIKEKEAGFILEKYASFSEIKADFTQGIISKCICIVKDYPSLTEKRSWINTGNSFIVLFMKMMFYWRKQKLDSCKEFLLNMCCIDKNDFSSNIID